MEHVRDPIEVPRNLEFETRGIAFATMSTDRIAVLHQYQRIWRYVWMDTGSMNCTQEDRQQGWSAGALVRILRGPLGRGLRAP